MANKILTAAAVGKLFGVHRFTITRWIDNGRLKGFKTVGGHRRVRLLDLVDFCEVNEIPIPDEVLDSLEQDY